MNATIDSNVEPLIRALMYEGYLLYPYRPTSLKNQYRWTFGTIAPRGVAQGHGERSAIQAQCLVEATADTRLDVVMRCLHPRQAQDEDAVERQAEMEGLRIGSLCEDPAVHWFSFAGDEVSGQVVVSGEWVMEGVMRLTIGVENLTEGIEPQASREAMQLRSLTAVHTLLKVDGGQFVSSIDPPAALAALSRACRNDGAFPVLVGRPGGNAQMLCSPIILYDYPQMAAESPGDLFDATEIDEILTLRINTLTDEEKAQVLRGDPRGRAVLARSEALARDQRERLHGAIGYEDRTITGSAPTQVEVDGLMLKPGDPVLLEPKRRADAMDLLLAGRQATIVSIEQDFENRTFVTVTIDADPGRDLGRLAQPGHRFFFAIDEIKPLVGAAAQANA